MVELPTVPHKEIIWGIEQRETVGDRLPGEHMHRDEKGRKRDVKYNSRSVSRGIGKIALGETAM